MAEDKAFPKPYTVNAYNGEQDWGSEGMDLRDYFAAHAPPPPEQWIEDTKSDGGHVVNAYSSWAYFYADDMMKEREK